MNPCDDELQEWPGPFLKMSCCEAVFWSEGNTCKGQTYPYICHIVNPSQKIGVVFDADFWLYLMKESRNYYDLNLERFEEQELKEWIVGKFQRLYSHEQFVHLLYNFDDNGKDNIFLRVERLRKKKENLKELKAFSALGWYNCQHFVRVVVFFDDKGHGAVIFRVKCMYFDWGGKKIHDVVDFPFSLQDAHDLTRFIKENIMAYRLEEGLEGVRHLFGQASI